MIKDKNTMKGDMNRRVLYGSEDFERKVSKEYKIEAIIKPKVRPRKGLNAGK